MQQVKPPPTKPASYLRTLSGVPAAPPLTQLLVNAPAQPEEHGLSAWTLPSTWNSRAEFQALGFSTGWSYSCSRLGVGVNQ